MIDSRQLAWPAFLVSAALILFPLADSVTSLYPWNIADPRWRFGAIGLLSNALILPVLGALIAHVTAAVLRHRAMRRLIGVVATLAGAVIMASLAIFALDALQTRASVQPQMQLSFTVATITAAVKTLLAGATLLAIGITTLRALRAERRDSTGTPAPIVGGLVLPAKRQSTSAKS